MTTILTVIPTLIITVIGTAIILGLGTLMHLIMEAIVEWRIRKMDHEK